MDGFVRPMGTGVSKAPLDNDWQDNADYLLWKSQLSNYVNFITKFKQ